MPDHTTPETGDIQTSDIPETRDAWLRLRRVIADEYIGKLPEIVPVDEFARLTGLTIAQVRHATTTGDLVVSLRDGHRGIAPVDNIPFLIRERLLRLTRSAPRRTRPAGRALSVSHAAYERVWDEAVRNSIDPQDALDRLLLAPMEAAEA